MTREFAKDTIRFVCLSVILVFSASLANDYYQKNGGKGVTTFKEIITKTLIDNPDINRRESVRREIKIRSKESPEAVKSLKYRTYGSYKVENLMFDIYKKYARMQGTDYIKTTTAEAEYNYYRNISYLNFKIKKNFYRFCHTESNAQNCYDSYTVAIDKAYADKHPNLFRWSGIMDKAFWDNVKSNNLNKNSS